MRTFTDDDLGGAEFTKVNLTGAAFDHVNLAEARFVASGLGGVVVRGSEVSGMELDDPWLLEDEDAVLLVNGVNVAPLVDRELDRRFPGRDLRRATDPAQLQAAWAALERTWAETVRRAEAMEEATLTESVAGEWSFTQTLRHLLVATDMWLGKAVLQREQPFHPLGLMDGASASQHDLSAFSDAEPEWAAVLAARGEHQAMVRDFVAGVTTEQLAEQRPNPHAPEYSETVLSCLRTIIEEEWEHHRYAVRDLDVIDQRAAGQAASAN